METSSKFNVAQLTLRDGAIHCYTKNNNSNINFS